MSKKRKKKIIPKIAHKETTLSGLNKPLKVVVKLILGILTILFGTGIIWQVVLTQPNLIIELTGSAEFPLQQELLIKNSGGRTAIIGGVYLTDLKLRANSFNWNQKDVSAGPVLSSVDYELTPDQTYKFNLEAFNGNLPGILFNRKFQAGTITLQVDYYDMVKWKFLHRKIYFYFALRKGTLEQTGSFLQKYLRVF